MKTHGRWHHVAHIAILILAVWIAYGKSLYHDFAWDDYGLIVNNEQVKGKDGWQKAFFQHFWKMGENVEDPTRNFYRPLISLSYKTDYALWGLDPRGYHLMNIIFHCVAAISSYLIVLLLFKNSILAFLGTLIWAIHPTHVENVCWISGRTDVYCGVWFLISFYLFLWWMRGGRNQTLYAAGIVMAYTTAVLYKEMAITLPFLFLAYYLLAKGKKPSIRTLAFLLLLIFAATGAYLAARFFALGKIAGQAASGTMWQRLVSLPMVFSKYIGLLFLFTPIDPHHSEDFLNSVWSASFFVGFCACVLYACWLWWLFRKGERLILFLFLWFLITLVPVSYLGSFGDVLYADRFLYIPSVGFIQGILLATAKWLEKRVILRTALKRAGICVYSLYVVLMLSYAGFNSNYWRNSLTLFYRATYTSPGSAYVHFNLGNSLSRIGAYEEAYQAYKKAVKLVPGYGKAYVNMGATLNKLGHYEDAVACFLKAMALGDSGHLVFANLGNSYNELGDRKKTQKCYEKSLAVQDTHWVHNRLGMCLLNNGFLDQAYEHFKQALDMQPTPEVYNNLGLFFLIQGEPEKATIHLNNALSADQQQPLHPELYAEIHFNLARALEDMDRSAEALDFARKAWQLIKEEGASSDIETELEHWIKTAEAAARGKL